MSRRLNIEITDRTSINAKQVGFCAYQIKPIVSLIAQTATRAGRDDVCRRHSQVVFAPYNAVPINGRRLAHWSGQILYIPHI